MEIAKICLVIISIVIDSIICQTGDNAAVLAALKEMGTINPETCKLGPGVTIDVLPDYSIWDPLTRTPILTSNLLTAIVLQNNGTLNSIPDKAFYNMCKNNVIGQNKLFASDIAVEPGVYAKYHEFSPYAWRADGKINAVDLSLTYSYLRPEVEWYQGSRSKNYNNAREETTSTKFREGNLELPAVEETLLYATREDGHWTKPYFDCGGGNIWMVTYSSPILGRDSISGVPVFKGVATLDIDLTSIDVNQCDPDGSDISDTFLNAFQGTHNCQPTSGCEFKAGTGFKAGGYQCSCKKGYYFPNPDAICKAFSGEDIEKAIKEGGDLSQFDCKPCAKGCHECIDDKTCVFPIGYKYDQSSSSNSSDSVYDINDHHNNRNSYSTDESSSSDDDEYDNYYNNKPIQIDDSPNSGDVRSDQYYKKNPPMVTIAPNPRHHKYQPLYPWKKFLGKLNGNQNAKTLNV